MPTVKVGDINMRYEAHGVGDPLVLLPGIGLESTTCFFRQIPVLAKNYRVIAIDNRGTGLSDKPDIPYSMDMMAKDVAGLLESLGIRKAHVYGVSLGGMVAQHFALCYPQMTASLILACTTCGGKHSVLPDQAVVGALFDMQGTPEERAGRLLPFIFSQGFIRTSPDVIQHAGSLYLEYCPPPHAFMRQGEASMTHDTYDRLPEIGVPTLVIAGTEDGLIPAENSRILASRIPGAESITLEGVGHLLSVEAPEAVNKAIHDFLKRHPIAA
jgi:3-oxoadipate enol-lactonase